MKGLNIQAGKLTCWVMPKIQWWSYPGQKGIVIQAGKLWINMAVAGAKNREPACLILPAVDVGKKELKSREVRVLPAATLKRRPNDCKYVRKS